MSEVDKTKRYDPKPERMYILGAIRAFIRFDPELDDTTALLDDIVDEMLVDAFKFGWMACLTQGEK